MKKTMVQCNQETRLMIKELAAADGRKMDAWLNKKIKGIYNQSANRGNVPSIPSGVS